MKPVLTHLQRQYIKWAKWWLKEKDTSKKAIYERNTRILNNILSKERQR